MRPEPDETLIEFAGSLAHELANILTAAAGNLSLLEESLSENELAQSVLGDLRRAHIRGFALSVVLKTIAGRQPLHVEQRDVNAMIRDFVEEAHKKLPAEFAIEARPAPEACNAFIDADKLSGVLEELLNNAQEAMPKGGRIRLETTQVSAPGGDFIRLAFSDNGMGMEPKLAARACLPLVTTKPAGFRNGWGLAIAEGLIRQLGGHIEIESTQGRGTTVSLFLPQAHRPAAPLFAEQLAS
jgi:signal transduction histidine kinase